MPLALQAKLLSELQDKEVRPDGSTDTIKVAVRVISATHRNLEQDLANGQFREDLYYRLIVVALEIPARASRREDIPLLATHFLHRLAEKNRLEIEGFSPEAMELLETAPWPGNVQQMLNVIEQVVSLSTSPIVPASQVI